MTKIDLYNAKNSGSKIENDMVLKIVDVDTFGDTDKDGHDVTVTALKTVDGEMYTTVSGTIASSVDMLKDIIADVNEVTVKVIEKTSKGGRAFYQLSIIG